MAAGIIGALTAAPAVIEGITRIIGRFVPDPAAQAQLALEMQKLVAEREAAAATAVAEIAKAQAETNTVEAQSPSLFIGGWRPFVGWGCGIGLLYAGLVQPLLAWLTGIVNAALSIGIPMPPIPASEALMTVLTGMLGIAGLRSFDKLKGTAASDLGAKR
ncbi:3TM-type holin [Methylobacterium sp. NEAU 140]|uniref:3TM-type holin n=1 Tax=Methylobacterium sp. NEAU 140 TaxID=3064945 RepID=UPI0027336F59|nr:3TM-type holin [Methylobacterium sp. NEAU 140]MDP4024469.1 3TM-type holin [Methylobacterium sp. NEAU 140]